MDATGESDIRLYYDRIHADQENELRAPLTRLIELLFLTADGPTRGREPPTWTFEFTKLWQLNEKEHAELRKVQAETDVAYLEQGVLDPEEVRDSRFNGDSYSIETVLKEREQLDIDLDVGE
jgi:phage-related protein (TIGR01555 family)